MHTIVKLFIYSLKKQPKGCVQIFENVTALEQQVRGSDSLNDRNISIGEI